MAFSTYYDPKGSFVSNWNPAAKDETTDEWLAQNMPWMGADTAEGRRERAGLTLFQGAPPIDPNDPYGPQYVAPEDQTFAMKAGLVAPTEEGQSLTAEQQAHADAMREYENDAVKEAALGGLSTGAVGGPWGAAIGAASAALGASYGSPEGYAESQIALEEEERVKRLQADAARLQAEAAVTQGRMNPGAQASNQDPLAGSYAYQQPAVYDDWYKSVFG